MKRSYYNFIKFISNWFFNQRKWLLKPHIDRLYYLCNLAGVFVFQLSMWLPLHEMFYIRWYSKLLLLKYVYLTFPTILWHSTYHTQLCDKYSSVLTASVLTLTPKEDIIDHILKMRKLGHYGILPRPYNFRTNLGLDCLLLRHCSELPYFTAFRFT
jgi:hypothetical protein